MGGDGESGWQPGLGKEFSLVARDGTIGAGIDFPGDPGRADDGTLVREGILRFEEEVLILGGGIGRCPECKMGALVGESSLAGLLGILRSRRVAGTGGGRSLRPGRVKPAGRYPNQGKAMTMAMRSRTNFLPRMVSEREVTPQIYGQTAGRGRLV